MKDRKGVKGLEALRADVSRFLLSRGIDRATGPQELSLGPILSGEDVLLIAPTGYGKTEATFGPLLQRLVEEGGKGIKLLYIAPLRALNRDMRLRMEGWCEDLGLSISVRHSDTTQGERNRQARNPPDVMVTTPETLQIMFTGSRLRKGLMNVRHVIIDEIHELHGDERGAQLDMALARLDRLAGREVQRVGLSATVEDPEDMASFLGGGGREVRIITGDWRKEYSFLVDSPTVLDEDNNSAESLGCTPKMASVIRRMAELIEEYRSSLIFVNSRDLAEALTTRMKAYRPELPIGIHHGSLSREARMEMEDRFKAGELKALFCTSSLELGMDIGRIELVIQFKSPKEVSRLMQRGGRAGHRVGDVSRCVVLATEADDVLEAAVIASKAKRGELERRRARKGILTVLSNQILSMATAEGSVDMREFHSIANSTYTFSELEWDRCLELFRYLGDSHLIFIDEETGVASRGRNTRKYFYDNISMIPDERVLPIRDISTRGIIGTLDMDFVLSNLEPFSKFIVRGQPWRVVDIREDEVIVEPIADLGPVPAWSGEDIPVPWEVAQGVARVRGDLMRWIREGGEEPVSFSDLPLSEGGRGCVLDTFRLQVDEEFETPDLEKITLEYGLEGFVIGICGGTKVNETIGRMVGALLSARYGGGVVVDFDPYRILLKGEMRLKPDDIEWALSNMPIDDLQQMVPILLKNSPLLRWQMLHVAKKFGVMKRDVDPMTFPLKRLLVRWKETLIMEESVERIIHNRMDMEHSKLILDRIFGGKIELVSQKISPLTMATSQVRAEFMTPGNAGREVIRQVSARLMRAQLKLTCMKCGAALRVTAERTKEIECCHRCGAKMLAPLPAGDLKTQKAVAEGVKGKVLKGDDRKRFKAAAMAGELFMTYGYKTVMCMAARGVGPKTAGRILMKHYDDDDELVKEIFGQEIKYARTRRFWE